MIKYISRLSLAFSILFNTMLGGSTNQSFSARNWQWKKDNHLNFVWLIDLMFFLEKDHCLESYIKWTIINHAITHYEGIVEKHTSYSNSI